MSVTKWQIEARERHCNRILTLLGARKGGTTAAEMCSILGMSRCAVNKWTKALIEEGRLTRHGDWHKVSPRYTLPDDALTRPIVPALLTSPKRQEKHRERAAAILRLLASGHPRSRAFLAREMGEDAAELLLPTINRLLAERKIERIGNGNRRKYRLVGRVRVAA